jgi:hypothetical protein
MSGHDHLISMLNRLKLTALRDLLSPRGQFLMSLDTVATEFLQSLARCIRQGALPRDGFGRNG